MTVLGAMQVLVAGAVAAGAPAIEAWWPFAGLVSAGFHPIVALEEENNYCTC